MTETFNAEYTVALEGLNEMYIEVTGGCNIEGKTIKEWSAYYTLYIPQGVELYQLRELLRDATNKMQEGTNYANQMSYTYSYAKISEETSLQRTKDTIMVQKLTKTLNRADNMARATHSSQIARGKLAETIATFFDDQVKKLKATIHSLEIISYSMMSEMKNLKHDYVE